MRSGAATRTQHERWPNMKRPRLPVFLPSRVVHAGLTISLSLAFASPAFSQSSLDTDDLRRELAALKTEQARTSARIETLEKSIETMTDNSKPMVVTPPEKSAAAVNNAIATPTTRLALSGDLRLRYESNRGENTVRNRDRGVLRARLRGAYAISDALTIGAQLSTGDPDDPNTADVTLSNFDDDLLVSLDQLYVRAKAGNLALSGGKMPLPFKRTDLVWDGDVSPQGVAATYLTSLGERAALELSGLYFLIDEATGGPDSRMIGAQVKAGSEFERFRLDVAAGYYDYRLASLAGADAGDFRSNLRTLDGRFLSDFRLLDIIGSITSSGLGNRWPVTVTADLVHNFGARTAADTGYSIDAFVGRSRDIGDWRFGYGFARAEVDAVFAAFSNDNLTIATNYRLHTLSLDYVPLARTQLNLTYYRFRLLDPALSDGGASTGWLDRLRANLVFSF